MCGVSWGGEGEGKGKRGKGEGGKGVSYIFMGVSDSRSWRLLLAWFSSARGQPRTTFCHPNIEDEEDIEEEEDDGAPDEETSMLVVG